MPPLIADFEQIVYRSPDPANLYCYSPWLDRAFDGRLVLAYDIAGPALTLEPGPKSDCGDYGANQCRIHVSDDHGRTWRRTGLLGMRHARVFAAGNALYCLGHSGRLLISRSTDNGETWSEPVRLADGFWHQAPCAYDRHNGLLLFTMEQEPAPGKMWRGGDPVLLSVREDSDLCDPASWHFSNIREFRATLSAHAELGNAALMPYCWLESNVVRQHDERSLTYDPTGRTVLLFLRVNGLKCKNMAMVLQGSAEADGTLSIDTLKLPDGGGELLFTPFPGGNMKFQIAYDEAGGLYWLIATQNVMTSVANPDKLPSADMRWSDERRRLELFYSQNLFDWCSAGLVDVGPDEIQSRHYASLLIDGDDLLVLSRSGDEQAKNSHDTDLITLHRVRNFRALAI